MRNIRLFQYAASLGLILGLIVAPCALAQTQGSAQAPGDPQDQNQTRQADAPHLPVAPPDGAQLLDHSGKPRATFPLIIKPIVQLGGLRGNIAATQTVDGKLVQTTFGLADGSSASVKQADASMAAALDAAGFSTLFACHGSACGPQFALASPGYRAAPDRFGNTTGAVYYRAARRDNDGGDTYVSVEIASADGQAVMQYDVLHSQPREVGAISVDATEMARQIDQTGRVVLYGLYFDTDSADIKPASRSTLAQIAKLLSQKPKLRLLVVGHTDSQGSFEYNIKLSSARAASVVKVLEDEYKIDPSRLRPVGVGYAAPRASNSSDAGRARNRRVELVPW